MLLKWLSFQASNRMLVELLRMDLQLLALTLRQVPSLGCGEILLPGQSSRPVHFARCSLLAPHVLSDLLPCSSFLLHIGFFERKEPGTRNSLVPHL